MNMRWIHLTAALAFASPAPLHAGILKEPKPISKRALTVKEASLILDASAASVDLRYKRDEFPKVEKTLNWASTAWRGERVHGQFLVWSGTGLTDLSLTATDLKSPAGDVISSTCVSPFYVRYTRGENDLLGDILEPTTVIDIPQGSTRPIWLSIDIPADATPGIYTGQLQVKDAFDHSAAFNLNVEVLPHVLPSPGNWSFHLDLWQHPWAVARVHGLEPWSPEHWAKLKEVLTLAASAGQKCLTISLVDRPWGGQTYDPFGPMVKPTRHADGTWSYDYSLFDQYVEFGIACGIKSQINCYSMVPWGNFLYFQDESQGEYTSIKAEPGRPAYKEFWTPFLKSFSAHLKEKGWLEITTIAMDERLLPQMQKMIELVDELAPEIKLTLAANRNLTAVIDRIHDYSFAIKFKPNATLNRQRTKSGKKTTFYVCCSPMEPNTFPFSPPAESTWLGWWAAAAGYDGFLRWALCSYTEDPFMTTDYPRKNWPTGDCFLIYPGPRSSIRFERLREGIQDYEKIRILRDLLARQADEGQAHLEQLDAILGTIKNSDHTAVVNNAKAALLQLTREITFP